MTKMIVPASASALVPAKRGIDTRDPVGAYLASLAPGSRRTQEASLRQLVMRIAPGVAFERFPWAQVSYKEALAMRRLIADLPDDEMALATKNRYIAALRGVMKSAWRLELITAEHLMRCHDALKVVRGTRDVAGRMLSIAEVKSLFDVCAASVDERRASRDIAILTMLRVGLRREEVAGALVDNYDRSSGDLTVIGKGNKQRVARLGESARFVTEWLAVRSTLPARDLPTIITHVETKRRLTAAGVNYVMQDRAREAGVSPIPTAHDFRRTFISELLKAGVDLSRVQQLAGHSDPATTARYDRRGDEELRDAMGHLYVWGTT